MDLETIKSNSLVTKLLEHKYRTKSSHIEIGKALKISNVYVCMILNHKIQPSPAVLFRIKEYLEEIDLSAARQKENAVQHKPAKAKQNASVDKCVPTKLRVTVKHNDKLLDKVSHKKPPKPTVKKIAGKK